MKCYKLRGLLPLFLLLFVFLCPTVKAIEIPKMTENQANQIIEYFINDTSWTSYRINSNDYVSRTELVNNLSLQNAKELADIFNLTISNYSGDIDLNWNNINLIIAKGNNSNNSHCFTYSFIISNYDVNEENILDFISYAPAPAFTRFFNTEVFENRKCYYFQIRFEWQNNIGDFFVENEIQELTLKNSIKIYPRQAPTISNNNISFISLVNLGIQNNPIYHTQHLNGYYLNIKNLGLENQKSYIEDKSSGDSGYYFINDGILTIDYNQWRTQNLKQYFFIGKNLNMISSYYYYNNSGERINANELIHLNSLDYPASGDKTGKLYFPQTSWVRYRDYYPYNIYQYLNVQFISGDEILEEKTVVDDLLVINWSDSSISGDIIGTTIGTITNSSGDVIGNYSGDSNFGDLNQNDFQNDISNTTDELISSISGELSNNEIIGALNSAEQGLIDIFQSKPGDFIISWDNVILYDKTFIPSGEINFSAYCRDVPILGQIKIYLNIILSALFSFAIIRQVYNLLLGALGIDDPNLYEHSTDESLGRNADTSPGYTYMTRPGLRRAIRHQNMISKNIYKRDLKRYREERRRRDS